MLVALSQPALQLQRIGQIAVMTERDTSIAVERKVGWAFFQTLAPVVE